MDCLQDVYLYLENLAEEIANKVFARFPGLVGEVLEVVSKVLIQERDIAKDILDDIIESEQGYLFTNDFDYLMNRTEIVTQGPNNQKLDSKTIFVRELRTRIDSYFALVIRNIRDKVPKTIGFFLVHKCQDKIQFHLYNEINQNPAMADVLGEHPAITEERESLSKKLEILKNSSKVLMRDPEITSVISLDDEKPKPMEEERKSNRARPMDSQRSFQESQDPRMAQSTRPPHDGGRKPDFFDNFDDPSRGRQDTIHRPSGPNPGQSSQPMRQPGRPVNPSQGHPMAGNPMHGNPQQQ